MNQENLTLRPEVLAFARLMEQRLREKDADKGQGWKDLPAGHLRVAMFSKAGRLERAIISQPTEMNECVTDAVDLANYCMMIADVSGALEDTDLGQEIINLANSSRGSGMDEHGEFHD